MQIWSDSASNASSATSKEAEITAQLDMSKTPTLPLYAVIFNVSNQMLAARDLSVGMEVALGEEEGSKFSMLCQSRIHTTHWNSTYKERPGSHLCMNKIFTAHY